jgi:DNA polymerase III delta' subunit
VLAAVARAIDRGRPPHALLLVGPGGIGKTTLALDLAAGLLCLDPDPAARPCRACAGCRKVEHGNHPDLHRLAPEGAGEQIRLAQVQGLTGDMSLLPMEGRWRVAVIEAAHRLNPDAQNALLKTLEEPVGFACIVLAVDDPTTILPTVESRSARLRMGPVPSPEIAALLVEGGLLDASQASAVARASGGRPGVAVGLARDPTTVLAAARLARNLLDLTHADRRRRLAVVIDLLADAAILDTAIRGGSLEPASLAQPASSPGPARAPRASDGAAGARATRAARAQGGRAAPAERRRAAIRVLSTWREVGRDLAVVCRGGAIEVRHLDLLEDLRVAAAVVDLARLLHFLERLDGLVAAIEAYANPELALDALVLAWPGPARAA